MKAFLIDAWTQSITELDYIDGSDACEWKTLLESSENSFDAIEVGDGVFLIVPYENFRPYGKPMFWWHSHHYQLPCKVLVLAIDEDNEVVSCPYTLEEVEQKVQWVFPAWQKTFPVCPACHDGTMVELNGGSFECEVCKQSYLQPNPEKQQ